VGFSSFCVKSLLQRCKGDEKEVRRTLSRRATLELAPAGEEKYNLSWKLEGANRRNS